MNAQQDVKPAGERSGDSGVLPAGSAPLERVVRRHATALEWLNSLRPALPWSIEACKPMSGGELRRHMQQGGVLVNGERVSPDELIDSPVFSLVFFPKSAARRTTLV